MIDDGRLLALLSLLGLASAAAVRGSRGIARSPMSLRGYTFEPPGPTQPWANRCQRCGLAPVLTWTGSRFNTESICRTCEEKEKAHPAYSEAVAAELQSVRAGDYNFIGIGLPSDLREEARTRDGSRGIARSSRTPAAPRTIGLRKTVSRKDSPKNVWELVWDPKRPSSMEVNGPRWSDWAFRNDDGRIAYEFPERVPDFVKRAVARTFKEVRSGETGSRGVSRPGKPVKKPDLWWRTERVPWSEPGTRWKTAVVSYGFNPRDRHLNQIPHFSFMVGTGPRAADGGCAGDPKLLKKNLSARLKRMARWHLTDADGTPMHYVANGAYWGEIAAGRRKNTDYGPDPIGAFKSTIVWGAVPSMDFGEPWLLSEATLTDWLEQRLPWLQHQFELDLEESRPEEKGSPNWSHIPGPYARPGALASFNRGSRGVARAGRTQSSAPPKLETLFEKSLAGTFAPSDLRAAVFQINEPLAFVCADNELLCRECCRVRIPEIVEAMAMVKVGGGSEFRQWAVVGVQDAEHDDFCANCEQRIVSRKPP